LVAGVPNPVTINGIDALPVGAEYDSLCLVMRRRGPSLQTMKSSSKSHTYRRRAGVELPAFLA
jgi:hypothetical protein